MGTTPGSPYLSIILTGRNDDFGGDFNGRLFRALEFNHRHLTDRGVPHEFVFVEWRPLDGRPWLAEVLADRYPELVPHTLTSYVADAAYHDAYSLNPRLQFQEFIAKNIGIRRSRGRFLLTTNTDIYLSRGALDTLQRQQLEPRILYRAPRFDLKEDIECDHLDWAVLEDERNRDTANLIRPPLYTNAAGDFLLLDRETYLTLRGFNEVYRLARVHMDGNFCLKAHSAGLALQAFDWPVYHVGRGTLNSQKKLYADRPREAPWGDTRWKQAVVYDNDANWGLKLAPARSVRPGVDFLAFTWAAVPPVVALRRVVLPVERASRPSAVAQTGSRPYPITVAHADRPDTTAPAEIGEKASDGEAIDRARLDFLASLDWPLTGKRVLDAGCGVGRLSAFFASRGCHVIGIDRRSDLIATMSRVGPDVEGVVGDVLELDLARFDPIDIVHCTGLLDGLDNPMAALHRLAVVCRGHFVFDVKVCDSSSPVLALASEPCRHAEGRLGLAYRPSPSLVVTALDRLGFPHVYGTTRPPMHPDFQFEWRNDLQTTRDGRSLRCVFIASRVQMASPHLVELVERD